MGDKINNQIEAKEKLIKAKSLVINGATLKEASKKTGISENILRKHSAKEKWMQQQEEFYIKICSTVLREYGESHIEARAEAIEHLRFITQLAMESIKNDTATLEQLKIYQTAINIIIKCIDGEIKLMGLPDINTLYRNYKFSETTKEEKQDRNISIKVIN